MPAQNILTDRVHAEPLPRPCGLAGGGEHVASLTLAAPGSIIGALPVQPVRCQGAATGGTGSAPMRRLRPGKPGMRQPGLSIGELRCAHDESHSMVETDPPVPPEQADPPERPDVDAFEDAIEPASSAEVRRASAGAAHDPGALAVLVRRIVHHDEAALADLYGRLSTRVFRQASRLVGDIGAAEEVVEDVFWQVWRQAPRFDAQRGPVIAWVLQMTRSRALDALRASGRNPLFKALDVDDEVHAVAAEDADPLEAAERAGVSERVRTALALLDPLRRQLVSLAFEHGYSQSEIAQQMGLPLGTVKSHIRRGLAAMKTRMEGTQALAVEREA
jgi:RNA polymerase sigma factor (sigma-70 family)